MIAAWLVYALVVGSLLAIAAALAEAALGARRLPTRWVWAAAIVATVGLASIAPLRASAGSAGATLELPAGSATALSAPREAPTVGPFGFINGIVAGARARWDSTLSRASAFADSPRGEAFGRLLLIGWGLCSAILVIAYLATTHQATRQRRTWPVVEVDGVRVRVSPRLGPLVMGIVRPEIVVPRWLLGADARERRLVLAHEREHVRRADPVLLALGWFAAALLPWHPAAWWMLTRLRLAIETDCDERVLRAGVDRAAYGSMLLDVAGRRTDGLVGAPGLLGGYSQLERRLRMMTNRSARFSRIRSLVLGAVSGVVVLAACDTEVPTAAEIAGMDVAAAEDRLQHLARGPVTETQYFVDGVQVSAEAARALGHYQIASIHVRGSTAETGVSRVVVTTKEGARAIDGQASGQVLLFEEAAHGQRVLIRGEGEARSTSGDSVQGQGLLLRGRTEGGEPVVLVLEDDQVRRIDLRRLRTISPDRIESVDVIKDPTAARAVHDAPEAENGVIRIRMRPTGHQPDVESPQEVVQFETGTPGNPAAPVPGSVRDTEPQ